MDLVEPNIGNLITLITGIVGVTASYFTMKNKVNYIDNRLLMHEEIYKGDKEENKTCLNEMKTENKEIYLEHKSLVVSKTEILHNRITKTQQDFKEYIGKTDVEFKEINKNMNEVLIETSEIKGLLKNLLDKK